MEINNPLQWDTRYFWTCIYRGRRTNVYALNIKDARIIAARRFALAESYLMVHPDHITAIQS